MALKLDIMVLILLMEIVRNLDNRLLALLFLDRTCGVSLVWSESLL